MIGAVIRLWPSQVIDHLATATGTLVALHELFLDEVLGSLLAHTLTSATHALRRHGLLLSPLLHHLIGASLLVHISCASAEVLVRERV